MNARVWGSPLVPAVLAGACLAACRVGPNYHAPALPPKAEAPLVSLNAAVETTATPPDAWWRLYDDPRLDQLVQEALKANFDLAAADAEPPDPDQPGQFARRPHPTFFAVCIQMDTVIADQNG